MHKVPVNCLGQIKKYVCLGLLNPIPKFTGETCFFFLFFFSGFLENIYFYAFERLIHFVSVENKKIKNK